MSGSK